MRFLILAFAGAVLLLAPSAAQARDTTITSSSTGPRSSCRSTRRRAAARRRRSWRATAGAAHGRRAEAASDETTGNVSVETAARPGSTCSPCRTAAGSATRRHGRDAPDKEAQDVQALIDWLAQQRAGARQGGRPARQHDRRLLRGRHRADHRRDRQAHRRDRADHRLAQPHDVALQGADGQRAAGRPRSSPRASRPPRPTGPAWCPRSPPA